MGFQMIFYRIVDLKFFRKMAFATFFLAQTFLSLSQTYTTYFTGNPEDKVVSPMGGICLMGGASENDNAMRWFLGRANGGDILVLRASGSDGYNDYLYEELGVNVNSVETIVFHNASASNDTDIHEKLNKAEAIWIAGGDQWNYVSYWRNTPIAELINKAIRERNIAIGGTSAGMAILGQFYFSAQNGTVTSSAALANPYASAVTPDTTGFLMHELLKYTITDTHYDNPNRKGRHMVFMARLVKDYGLNRVRGIACDEYTAVCIDGNGRARVFGSYPQYDDFAWFLQINCESADPGPEVCQANTPLHWLRNSKALKIYKIAGTDEGSNYFQTDTWESGFGGSWEDWFVNQGVFNIVLGSGLSCTPLNSGLVDFPSYQIKVYPNPLSGEYLFVNSEIALTEIRIYNLSGILMHQALQNNQFSSTFPIESLASGIYVIHIRHSYGEWTSRLIVP